jgi:hypothetical protein
VQRIKEENKQLREELTTISRNLDEELMKKQAEEAKHGRKVDSSERES